MTIPVYLIIYKIYWGLNIRSVFRIIFLSLLFLTGACSTEPKIQEDPPIRGFQDTLKQIGSTTGMTQWNKEEYSTDQVIKEQLFLSGNSFKKINIQIYNGWYANSTTGAFEFYNNEAVTQFALEGNLIIINNFTLREPDYSSHTTRDITTEMLAKGFSEIYQVTITAENIWTSSKAGSSGIWEKSTPNNTEYYLVKKSANTLQMITIYYDETLDKYGTYGILDDNVLNNIHLSYTL